MAGPGAEHPHPERLLAFLEKYPGSLAYIKANADMVARDYPASAAKLLPKLRDLYGRMKGKIPAV